MCRHLQAMRGIVEFKPFKPSAGLHMPTTDLLNLFMVLVRKRTDINYVTAPVMKRWVSRGTLLMWIRRGSFDLARD
jgi:hypothetical protein